MSNQDGKVIINIDSNAAKVSRDFDQLGKMTDKYERVLQRVEGTANSSLPVYDKIRTKLKEQQNTINANILSYQKLANAQKSGIGFNQLNSVTIAATDRLRNLALQGKQNSVEFQKLAQTVRNVQIQMSSANNIVNKATGFNQLGNSILNLNNALGAFSLGYIINQVHDLGKSVVNTSMDFQALENRMNASAADKSIGADSLSYIRKEADRLGLSFKGTADSFAGFEAAALRSGLTLGQTKQIFSDISTAATSMQLSATNVELTFKALEQIAGKGTVSMEELRQQLGDHLPGAFEIAAKSMGMTTREFYNMVSEGKVLSSEFLPAFARALKEELGGSALDASTQLRASINRLNTDVMVSSDAWGEYLQPSVQEGVEAFRGAAQASTKLANTLNKNRAEIGAVATSLTTTTTAFIAFRAAAGIQLSSALASLSASLVNIRTSALGLGAAISANPLMIGGAALAASIGVVTYALQKNQVELSKETQKLRELASETSNNAVETPRLVAEYHKLATASNRTGVEEQRLIEIKDKLNAQYPSLLDKYGQELNAQGELKNSTAQLIAQYIKLAEVQKLVAQQQAAEERYNKSVSNKWYRNENSESARRNRIKAYNEYAAAIDKSTEAIRALIGQENASAKVIKEGKALKDYTLGTGAGALGSSDGSSKSGREKRQLTISEQIQKAYNDEQRALEDLAAQGITSGKVWDAQVAKVKNLENAVKRIKEATDFGVITPFQGLNKQLQEAQERVMNLAASKVINIEELRKAKGDLTDLQKKMQEVQLAAQTSPYQAKTSQLSMLQSQYLDYAIQGYGNSEQALAIKNQYKTLKLEVERANASLQNSMGISWQNVSSTISSSLSQAITTPLQQGENALERFGNVALNTIQAIAQQMISSGLSKLFQEGAQNDGLLSNILGGNQGTMTGAAAPISAVSDELKNILAQAPQAAASIASIGTSQTAALTAMSGTSGVIASAMSGYASAATAAGQLAASLTQAAIAQAAYSAALVPIAGAVLAPVAATATGAAIGTANILASAGMLASRVTAFADGGIVDKPTYFPMKGNRMGLMGEAGTEAIMPLRRTPDGRLGVEAQVQQPNITIYNQSGASVETVQRPDGDTEIFIRKVNNALRNERTQSGFSSALQRNNSRGVQAS